jgi:choline-sulfatase
MAGAAPPQWANLRVLIADDLTYNRIRAMGNLDVGTRIWMHSLWRGCTFSNCFHQGSWSATVCVASRSMLNSGLTAFRARLR